MSIKLKIIFFIIGKFYPMICSLGAEGIINKILDRAILDHRAKLPAKGKK